MTRKIIPRGRRTDGENESYVLQSIVLYGPISPSGMLSKPVPSWSPWNHLTPPSYQSVIKAIRKLKASGWIKEQAGILPDLREKRFTLNRELMDPLDAKVSLTGYFQGAWKCSGGPIDLLSPASDELGKIPILVRADGKRYRVRRDSIEDMAALVSSHTGATRWSDSIFEAMYRIAKSYRSTEYFYPIDSDGPMDGNPKPEKVIEWLMTLKEFEIADNIGLEGLANVLDDLYTDVFSRAIEIFVNEAERISFPSMGYDAWAKLGAGWDASGFRRILEQSNEMLKNHPVE